MIFTSHNLRPLETIDKGFIAFTTTNQKNRYIRLTNVKRGAFNIAYNLELDNYNKNLYDACAGHV